MPPPPRRRASYLAIAAAIREMILSGQLEAGAQLPYKRLLAERYAVSIGVIDTVMVILRNEGLVEGRQGKGVYVARNVGNRPTT